MAAVQATPAMQQANGNNANMAAQNSILPPGMTKERVQQIYRVSHELFSFILPLFN